VALAAAALQIPLHHPLIASVIPSAFMAEQVTRNVDTCALPSRMSFGAISSSRGSCGEGRAELVQISSRANWKLRDPVTSLLLGDANVIGALEVEPELCRRTETSAQGGARYPGDPASA
jgi:hypothetical protein